jgi:hypothetical protein
MSSRCWASPDPVSPPRPSNWISSSANVPAKELQELARQLFDAFRSPLLRVEFRLQGKWRIATLKALHLHSLSAEQEEMFLGALATYLSRRWRQPRARSNYRYDLAMLHNPKEAMPPSNPKGLQQFIKIGRECGVNVELIEKKDFGRLAEFDALFIRETTGIDHYTYHLRQKGGKRRHGGHRRSRLHPQMHQQGLSG